MPETNLELKKEAAERVVDRMPGLINTATARALNRGLVSARTVMVREMAKDLGLKQADVRDRLQVKEASSSELKAEIQTRGRRLPLIAFGAKGPEPSRGRGRGVTYKLPTGRGRAPNAFIAVMKSGHRGVFQRRTVPGGGRLPIRQLYGPSLPRVFKKFSPEALERGKESFQKNLQSELRFARRKAGGE